MQIPKDSGDLKWSTVSVNYTEPKNTSYTLTGEFKRVVFDKIILYGSKSSRIYTLFSLKRSNTVYILSLD